MANPKHLKILLDSISENNGMKSWNLWRINNEYIIPNLNDANLNYANLNNANLNNAILYGASLNHANLTGASLNNAKLKYANLNNANLYNANLNYANLNYANLNNANLKGAKLFYHKCPQEGDFIAWKAAKLENETRVLLQIKIPSYAKRISTIPSNICRASKISTLAIYDLNGKLTKSKTAFSIRDNNTKYIIKKSTKSDSFNNDPRINCSHGISFFISKSEALDWANMY